MTLELAGLRKGDTVTWNDGVVDYTGTVSRIGDDYAIIRPTDGKPSPGNQLYNDGDGWLIRLDSISKNWFSEHSHKKVTIIKASHKIELKKGDRIIGRDGIRDYAGTVYKIIGNFATIKRDDGQGSTGVPIEDLPYHGNLGWVIRKRDGMNTWYDSCSNANVTILINENMITELTVRNIVPVIIIKIGCVEIPFKDADKICRRFKKFLVDKGTYETVRWNGDNITLKDVEEYEKWAKKNMPKNVSDDDKW